MVMFEVMGVGLNRDFSGLYNKLVMRRIKYLFFLFD